MKLFQQLFRYRGDELQKEERRLQSRYPIGPDFPLVVAVVGNGWNGTGRAENLAVGGLGLVLDRGPAVDTGSAVRLGLRLEGFEILAGGQLRHVKPREGRGFTCGVSLIFPESAGRQGYLQLLMPVSIGCSLTPVDPTRTTQDEPGIRKTVYAGESASRLTLWDKLEGSSETPFSFELAIGEHLLRGQEGIPGVQTLARGGDQHPHSTAEGAAQADEATGAELKRLFRWTVLNIGDNIPAPARKFLRGFVG